jgi:predicted nucleic acid-binding protein
VPKYIVDAQLMIRAFRYNDEAERYRTFLSASPVPVWLCSVVAQELLAGARQNELRRLVQTFIEPFEKVKRTAAPSHASWRRAGDVLNGLRRSGWTITPALTNDVLIACTAAEIGAEVIHDNERDYAAIRKLLHFRHRTDYPSPRNREGNPE